MFTYSLFHRAAELFPEWLTRSSAKENIENYLFYGYLLKGSKEAAAHQCLTEFCKIFEKLEASLPERLSSITIDGLFLAIVDVFFKTCDKLFVKVSIIVSRFKSLLIANGCDLSKLKCEIDILREHITKFLPAVTPKQAWPQIFSMKLALEIQNVLHVIEIGIALNRKEFSLSFGRFSPRNVNLLAMIPRQLQSRTLRTGNSYAPDKVPRWQCMQAASTLGRPPSYN